MKTSPSVDRRAHRRVPQYVTPWSAAALVRPGREAVLIDISEGGALIETRAAVLPGSSIYLHLVAQGTRVGLRGRAARCHVAAITEEDGIRYRAAIVFAARLSTVWPDLPAADPDPARGEYAIPRPSASDRAGNGQRLPVCALGASA
jgi:hypothetical protein